jgi:ethanolamine ammonia-lyase large subunit
MSTETGASILDGVLICIGDRISAILLNPADKDEKYIASLHNEVASITLRYKISGICSNQNFDLACCRMGHWPIIV